MTRMKRPYSMRRLGIAAWVLAVLAVASTVSAGDWPTYMHDGSRVGVTDEAARGPLSEHWMHRAPAPPRPAWPAPQTGWTELPKVDFDNASYAVADADTVYFGSSSESSVFAIDAATGKTRWKFHTSGAVRLAPTLANGKVYFGSDDGRVYCVNRADGTQAWAFNAARDNTLVLANGQAASLGSVRTNVLVEGDRVYVGAGVFPYHEVAAYALDANTGAVVWKNTKVDANGGFSPQGYLVAMKAGIVFLTGRALPVCLSRESGSAVFSVPKSVEKGLMTGDYGVAYNGVLFTGTQNVLTSTNEKGEAGARWPDTTRIMPTADSIYTLRGPSAPRGGTRSTSTADNTITATARGKPGVDGSPETKARKRWAYTRPGLASMILAGSGVFAGADNSVVWLDAAGKEQWVGKVEGTAVGLAFAHGRLIVSTTKGHVYCFAVGPAPAKLMPQPAPTAQPATVANVKAIVKEAGVTRGYALVLGKDAVEFACELARQSEFQITCVEPDAGKLAAARQRVDAAGLYGHRVTVETGGPDALPFPDFAGNLVVQLDAAAPSASASRELLNVIKPCGGVLLARAAVDSAEWREMGVASPVTLLSQPWTKFVRGELPGSGWWTHQYADAGNSGSSGDKRIKGRLGVLWYGEPGGDEAPDRHTRGAAPLLLNGRVFAAGIRYPDKTYLYSYDAYNGVRYWERDIPNAVRAGIPGVPGNLACNADSVFVASGATCYRVDAFTGEVRAKYAVPGAQTDAVWGFLSVTDGAVLGSAAFEGRVAYSNAVFAYDLATNKLRWNFPTSEIRNTAIAYGSGRLFFAQDRSATEPSKTGMPGILPFPDVKKETAIKNAHTKKKASEAAKKKADDEHGDDDGPSDDEPVDRLGKPMAKGMPVMRNVVAIDVATGAKAWDRDVDLTNCGAWNAGVFGTIQALCKGDVLLFAGAYTGYGRPKDDAPPKIGVALSTRDGSTFWANPIDTRTRPIFMQNALLSEPAFFDIHSGKKLAQPAAGATAVPQTGKEREWTIGGRAGACGSLSASDSMVFGRSGITIWRSVTGGSSGSFAGTRPGCMINIVPAGGVVVQAEASAGCVCTHTIQCTVVLRPVPVSEVTVPGKK